MKKLTAALFCLFLMGAGCTAAVDETAVDLTVPEHDFPTCQTNADCLEEGQTCKFVEQYNAMTCLEPVDR